MNVSKLSSAIIGTGGFIDIAQRARKVIFCGSLAVRAETELTSGGLRFVRHGRPKFVDKVDQVTFSARYALQSGQQVLYVTEAAVFRLTEAGVQIEEIAPGSTSSETSCRNSPSDPPRPILSERCLGHFLPRNRCRTSFSAITQSDPPRPSGATIESRCPWEQDKNHEALLVGARRRVFLR